MKICLTRHVLYDVCHLRIRKPPFSSGPHKNDQPAFSTISSLGTVFENWRFWCMKTPFTCGRKAKTGKKISFFKNHRTGVDGAWNMLKVSDWKLFVEFYSPHSTQVVSNYWCGWFHATIFIRFQNDEFYQGPEALLITKGEPAGLARLARFRFTGLAGLMPYFLLKLLWRCL